LILKNGKRELPLSGPKVAAAQNLMVAQELEMLRK
jgi:hypothetical protein